jgi:hypothetical protein
MYSVRRFRWASLVIAATASVGFGAAVATATAAAAPGQSARRTGASAGGPSVKLFNLNGYVIVTNYTLGRNTGNTFRQTYKRSTVRGVPIKGPSVGTKFPAEDYVAMSIGNHEVYVAWLDPASHALEDVFVMNFATHVVFDYAPGSSTPQSSGIVSVKQRGPRPLP